MIKSLYRLFIPLIIGGLVLLLGGCVSSESHADAIADAEQAFVDGEYGRSQEICNSITTDGLDKLSEQQLGRLAIIYMKLSEVPNGTDHVAEATQCYLQAWKISNDSMAAFTNGLPPEDLQYIMMLNRIGGSIVSPPDLSHEFEPEDTIVN